MNSERTPSDQGLTVVVWTPWGEQRVPRAESRAASVGRMVKRIRDQEVAERQAEHLR